MKSLAGKRLPSVGGGEGGNFEDHPQQKRALASQRFYSQVPPTEILALSLRHTSTLPTFASEAIFFSCPTRVMVVVVVRY